MEPYVMDWVGLLLRWLHVIAAIAWIGSSFYFVFLDSNLLKPTDPALVDKGVDGALWAVHGGGFYHPQKYVVAPPRIDSHLHWFYWESYTTWLSGFALFTVLYLFNAETYLIDPAVMAWSPPAAVAAALGLLLAFWLVYDGMCRLWGDGPRGDRILAVGLSLVVLVACWTATHWFSGRAAFLLVGAMLATAMSANVWLCIIPGQRKVVSALTSGQPVDASLLAVHGRRAKQRSVHNTYFTLPVVLAMISNHYPMLYSQPESWAVLAALMLAGALIRQYFVLKHGHRNGRNRHPWPVAAAGVGVLLAVVVWCAPSTSSRSAALPGLGPVTSHVANSPQVLAQTVRAVLDQRCIACHGSQMQMKNVRLDDAAGLRQHAQTVYQQVVVTRQMPMNNSTGMTDAERELVKTWWLAGAPVP